MPLLAARLSTQTTEAGAFAWSYTPWNGLPAAITNAAGLTFAGVTGFCGMARLLATMPWNRRQGVKTRSR